MEERIIALKGAQGRGALRCTLNGGTLRLRLSPPLPGNAEAHLAHPNGQCAAVPLESGRGEVQSAACPCAAIIVQDGRAVLSGGFAGREAMREKLMLQLGGPGQRGAAAPAEAATARPAEPAARPGPPERAPAPPPITQPPRSAALVEILQKAQELFAALPPEPERQPEPDANEPVLNPFPAAFPGSRWKRVNYPATGRCYLEGEMRCRGQTLIIHALPGEYAPVPPERKAGFTRFLRARDGSGFWIRVRTMR